MTTIEEHKKSIQVFEDDVKQKIREKKLFESQKIVGFDLSEAATNLFELYLHKKSLITEGFNVNHRFFASMKRAEEKFAFPFPEKPAVLQNLVSIEGITTKLCYGKTMKLEDVETAVRLFFELKKIIENQIGQIEKL